MTALLTTRGLVTGYGKKQVLSDVSVEVGHGEIVAVIGPKGSGKSTLLKAVCGPIPTWSGEIRFSGSAINLERAVDRFLANATHRKRTSSYGNAGSPKR